MNTANKNITFKQIIIAILGFIIINLIAGYGIVLLGADVAGIYKALNRPYFAPPTAIFGIVWTFNCILVTYGILLTVNLAKSALRTRLLTTQGLLVLNYCVFQYLSFGSPILFGKLLPIMFFVPTFTMLILTIIAMNYAYKLDTSETTFKSKILSGKSIFATFTSLFGWLLIATALGFEIWMMNK
jgi:translocator protein